MVVFSQYSKIVIIFCTILMAAHICMANNKCVKVKTKRVDVSQWPKELTDGSACRAKAEARAQSKASSSCCTTIAKPQNCRAKSFKTPKQQRQDQEQQLLKDIHDIQKKYLKKYLAGEKLNHQSARSELQQKIDDLPSALASLDDFPYYKRMIDIERLVIDIMNGKVKPDFKVSDKDALKILKQIQSRQLKALKHFHRNGYR